MKTKQKNPKKHTGITNNNGCKGRGKGWFSFVKNGGKPSGKRKPKGRR